MTWKQKYAILIKEIAERPLGEFPLVFIIDEKRILSKCDITDSVQTFNFRLPKNSSEQDYQDFCEYLLEYTNQDYNLYFKKSEFSNFGKKQQEQNLDILNKISGFSNFGKK